MKYVERKGNEIIFRSNGETIQITPWGKDSLRVRAAQMADIRDNRFALLDAGILVEIGQHLPLRAGQPGIAGVLLETLAQQARHVVEQEAHGRRRLLRSGSHKHLYNSDAFFRLEGDRSRAVASRRSRLSCDGFRAERRRSRMTVVVPRQPGRI